MFLFNNFMKKTKHLQFFYISYENLIKNIKFNFTKKKIQTKLAGVFDYIYKNLKKQILTP